jgi:hypothetical protein
MSRPIPLEWVQVRRDVAIKICEHSVKLFNENLEAWGILLGKREKGGYTVGSIQELEIGSDYEPFEAEKSDPLAFGQLLYDLSGSKKKLAELSTKGLLGLYHNHLQTPLQPITYSFWPSRHDLEAFAELKIDLACIAYVCGLGKFGTNFSEPKEIHAERFLKFSFQGKQRLAEIACYMSFWNAVPLFPLRFGIKESPRVSEPYLCFVKFIGDPKWRILYPRPGMGWGE